MTPKIAADLQFLQIHSAATLTKTKINLFFAKQNHFNIYNLAPTKQKFQILFSLCTPEAAAAAAVGDHFNNCELKYPETKRGADIAQWIRLRLPPCGPGSIPLLYLSIY